LALLLVVVSMALIGGMVSALASYSVRAWQRGQAERLRIAARAVADSAAEYARFHLEDWHSSPPAEAIVLDVAELLPSGLSGSATVDCSGAAGSMICQVSVEVRHQERRAQERFVVRLGLGLDEWERVGAGL
jgi:hypothetical protein